MFRVCELGNDTGKQASKQWSNVCLYIHKEQMQAEKKMQYLQDIQDPLIYQISARWIVVNETDENLTDEVNGGTWFLEMFSLFVIFRPLVYGNQWPRCKVQSTVQGSHRAPWLFLVFVWLTHVTTGNSVGIREIQGPHYFELSILSEY